MWLFKIHHFYRLCLFRRLNLKVVHPCRDRLSIVVCGIPGKLIISQRLFSQIDNLDPSSFHIEYAESDVSTFTYLASQKTLGTIFEVVNPIMSKKRGSLPSWGTYNNPDEGVIDIKGKEIKQLGIVVENAEETAKNYFMHTSLIKSNLIVIF